MEGIDVEAGCGDREVRIETWSVDFGVFFKVGADVSLATGAIAFDVLYNLGLSDIDKRRVQLKNRNIQMTIGYALLFGSS